MATNKFDKRSKFFLAKLCDKYAPCAFCGREADEETIYGKLYSIGNIYCHYFCVLLSCCLIQKGTDDNGLFGFLYPDILAEIERSKKHKCSYCGCEGATLGCCVVQCKKQFHLPCGREKNAVSLYYGNYKTFCQNHVPKQKIPDNIMEKAKLRKSLHNKSYDKQRSLKKIHNVKNDDPEVAESVCVICYEPVDGYPTPQTFWPPCCGRDAWFHRNCLQRMALSAGIHYLKCPLCNDKENFYDAVLKQGYYIPDRDAAWELEQNAFSEIYERSFSCNLENCLCPSGREFDANTGHWDILVCVLCGSSGAHAWCKQQAGSSKAASITVDESMEKVGKEDSDTARSDPKAGPKEADNSTDLITESEDKLGWQEKEVADTLLKSVTDKNQDILKPEVQLNGKTYANDEPKTEVRLQMETNEINLVVDTEAEALAGLYVCPTCGPSASGATNLVAALHALALQESSNAREDETVMRPRMPSRMSIRRTKPRPIKHEASSSSTVANAIGNRNEAPSNTEISRSELNLKPPRRRLLDLNVLTNIENKLITPIKLLEQGLNERISKMNLENIILDSEKVIESMRKKFTRPKPLAIKKKIVNSILEELLLNASKEILKTKEPIREWNSPRKKLESKENVQNMNHNISVSEKATNAKLINIDNIVIDSRTKTIDIQNDSAMEISANNESINIALVKIPGCDTKIPINLKSPVKSQLCSFKFSPSDNESLQNTDLGLDIESFKNHYLNEVDKVSFCQHNHKLIEIDNTERKLNCVKDLTIEKYKAGEKRKNYVENDDVIKKKKPSKDVLLNFDKTIRKKKVKKELLKSNKDVKIKIRWRKKKLKLKISKKKNERRKYSNDQQGTSNLPQHVKRCHRTEKKRIKFDRETISEASLKFLEVNRATKLGLNISKSDLNKSMGNLNDSKDTPKRSKGRPKISKKNSLSVSTDNPENTKKSPKVLKQYVLNYNFDTINKNMVVEPEYDVTPMKKKYIKRAKTSDNMKQMSIDSFFKRKSV